MGLMDFIKGELIDVIEWTDDSRDTLSFRFPDDDKAIKNGAQLIVRESQQVQFVYLGEFGDTFGPGKHTLTTDNIPVLTRLKSWKYGFNSPFKADVYYVTTRLFTGNKWGTANPIMMRDDDLGIVRARAFGTYDFRIVDPKLFLKEVAGSDQNFRLDEFADTMRSRIVSIFADALASAKIPVFDVASRYSELGEALLPLINPVVAAKYGLRWPSFIVENVSVPPEVEQAIDKRSSMAAVGNLNDYVKFQMAQGMEKGGGAGGVATEMAVGLAMAQQIMQQQGIAGRGARRRGAAPAAAAPAASRAAVASRRREGAGRPGSGRHDDPRVGRARRQEDRLVLAHQAQRARRVPRQVRRAGRSMLNRRSRKHACPACGAQAEWDPAKQKLCARSAAPSPRTSRRRAGAVEDDLVRALREIRTRIAAGRRRGARCSAGAARRSRCSIPSASGSAASSAGRRRSSTTRKSSRRSGRRACCRSRSPSRRSASRSAGGTRASGSRRAAEDRARSSTPSRASTFRTGRSTRRSVCPWEAEAGHYYYTTETYRDNKGHTQTRQVQHVRWEPASGVVEHFFDDEPVPGTRGRVTRAAAGRSSRFMTNELVAYDTAFLSGFVVEHYQVVLLDAAEASEESMRRSWARCAPRRFRATRTATW